jgi:heptaprenyl diphosphate synthase
MDETEMKENRLSSTQKIAVTALLIALAMVLSYIESQIQFVSIVPGIKLGLTNLVVMVALYRINEKEAIVINLVRIILVGMTFGSMFSMLYSMAGGILSGLVMILMKRWGKVTMTTVSMAGGIAHNVGQILVAMVVLQTQAMLYYLLVLWVTGIGAGIIIGLVSAQIVKRLPKNLIG